MSSAHPRSIAAASLAGLSLAALSACGGNGGDSEVQASDNCEETYTIGFSHPLGEVDAVQAVKNFSEERAEENGCVDLLLDGTTGADLESQRNTVESWVNQQIDAIVIWPADIEAFTGLQQEAQDNGTQWLMYSSEMEGADGGVGFDSEHSGQMIADNLEEWLEENYTEGDEITAAVTEMAALTQLSPRWDIPMEVLDDYGIEIVSFQDCGDTSCGLQVAEDALRENDDLRIFLGSNDDAGVGAARAFENADIDPTESYIAGHDGIPEAFEAIENETSYKASAAIRLDELGYSIIDNSIAAITGEGDPEDMAPTELVTIDEPETLEQMKALFE